MTSCCVTMTDSARAASPSSCISCRASGPKRTAVTSTYSQLIQTDFPADVTTSLLPAFNSFTFFEVSQTSYHAVREVAADGRVRLTVSGLVSRRSKQHNRSRNGAAAKSDALHSHRASASERSCAYRVD